MDPNFRFNSDEECGDVLQVSPPEFMEVDTQDGCSVWYFFRKERKGNRAECKDCDKIIISNKGSTSGMIKHLLTKHGVDLKEEKKKQVSKSSNR